MSYSTGIVYKIVCTQDSGIVYIGSTFNLLRQRWQEHKSHYTKYLNGKHGCISIYPYFSKYGIENFKILKIKEYECCRNDMRDRKHLEVYEQLWINKTKGCVNQVNSFCINKLRQKEYHEKNKEKISENQKEYREKNKEKGKEKVECEICKSIISKGALYLHKKSKKHILEMEKQEKNII